VCVVWVPRWGTWSQQLCRWGRLLSSTVIRGGALGGDGLAAARDLLTLWWRLRWGTWQIGLDLDARPSVRRMRRPAHSERFSKDCKPMRERTRKAAKKQSASGIWGPELE